MFVFYNLRKKETWKYNIDGLIWIGSGRTYPIQRDIPYYSREEQFICNEESLGKLILFFENLKNAGVIENFKISEIYDPSQ